MGEFFDYFRQKKNLANLLILGILILALPLAVQTVREQQIIKSRAAADPIVITGDNLIDLPGGKKGFKLNSAGKAVLDLEINSPVESSVKTVQSENAVMSLLPRGGLVETAYAVDCTEDCSVEVTYCDEKAKKLIKKHGGYCDTDSGNCVFAFNEVGNCGDNGGGPAPGGNPPPAGNGDWWGCSGWDTYCEDKSRTCRTDDGKAGVVCSHTCNACGTGDPNWYKKGVSSNGQCYAGLKWDVCVAANQDTRGGPCKETATLTSDCAMCIYKEKNKATGGNLYDTVRGMDVQRLAQCNYEQTASVWCNEVDKAGCESIKKGACSQPTAGSATYPASKNCSTGTPPATGDPNCPGAGAPDLGAACASCIEGKMGGAVNWLKSQPGFGMCNARQLVNHMCNGGVSADNKAECLGNKNGGCQASCTNVSPSVSPSPSPSAPPVTTKLFRVAEAPADFTETGRYGWQEYTSTPMKLSFEFKDTTAGLKNIFVEFKYSNDKTERRSIQIRLVGPDPAITNCSLTFEGKTTAILNLTGTNFGGTKGTIKSGEKVLEAREWKDSSIKAVFPNAPEGQKINVSITNPDSQSAESNCSAIAQLALGAKVFCRAPAQHNTDNVELTLAGIFEGGIKIKQKVTIDKEGVVQGLSQKLEAGKKYKVSIKAPKSLRRTAEITAEESGTTNIPNFVLPVGDIFPADGGDGTINSYDKAELNRQWIIAKDATGRSADFNKDNRVNSIDWACMRYDFGDSDHADPAPGAPSIGIGTTAPNRGVGSSPPQGAACIQVITPAKNPATGECKEFPTPCDLPVNWQRVDKCDTN